ncbi:MAG: hypothetical protein WA941_14865 [Nitrososphaeraceae archaeon]
MYSKPVIFVVISVLVGALVYSSISSFYVFAAPRDPNNPGTRCTYNEGYTEQTCCWRERIPGSILGELYCQTCKINPVETGSPCQPKELQYLEPSTSGVSPLEEGVLEQTPAPPSGPAAPLQDGGVLQQPPTQGVAPPVTRDQGVSPQDGALQQPPADQGATDLLPPPATEESQPATEQSVPVCQEGLEFNEDLGFCVPEDCPEGQVLDEESGVCVLEEPEVAEEPAESQPEQEQPSEESDSEDNSNN